jgi:hypothetical protein
MRLAISSVLALSGAVIASNAIAADDGKEQCAGITKAGKNDCAIAPTIVTVMSTQTATSKLGSISPRDRLERNRRKGMNAKTDFTLSFHPEAWEYSVVSHKALGNDYGSPVRA